MHIFLYEWVTGGGLVEEPGPLPASMLAEGAAMLTALAADFNVIKTCRVTVLRDMRLDELVLPDCEVVEIHSSSHRQEEIERLAALADHTLVIAPEFDGILLQTLALARQAGGNLLSAPEEFVELTTNKHRTALRLTEAGVPVPEALLLPADQGKIAQRVCLSSRPKTCRRCRVATHALGFKSARRASPLPLAAAFRTLLPRHRNELGDVMRPNTSRTSASVPPAP